MSDDRREFAQLQEQYVKHLADDGEVQGLSRELTALADRHNYSYTWRWLGLPIIQMPTDVVALQEVVWEHRPDLIVETGIARGGSVILFASLLELIGEGEVIGIDIDIRAHNRESIEQHPLAHRVTLVEGSSVDPAVVAAVTERASGAARVMVVLDSNHTHDHVLDELRMYAPLVTPQQFLVVADTIVEEIPPQTHRPRPWGPGNNPKTAVEEFLREDQRFALASMNGKLLMSSSQGGYLQRIA